MIILYNPRSTTPGKQPLPLSLMALAAVLEGRHAWTLVDGNVEAEPAARIIEIARALPAQPASVLAVTVMPGPQLAQAVPVCRQVRAAVPGLPIVWGGYFPTQHTEAALSASYVDYVVRSQGELAFLSLINVLQAGGALSAVNNLSWNNGRRVVHNPVCPLTPLDQFPDPPYHAVPLARYIRPTYLGLRTIAYNSSFGCPFACAFCASAAMAGRQWAAQSPKRMESAVRHLVEAYQVDSLQMNDLDFFVSESRTAEYCGRTQDLKVGWWAMGRADILTRYAPATWRLMRAAGLRMVFTGAESGSDEALARMNKGGQASTEVTLEFVRRAKEYGVVPELSFVLGSPPDPLADMQRTFEFIRALKRLNAEAEIVLYVYTPVPADGAMYEMAQKAGFRFPETLDDWASDGWGQFALRKGARLPWVAGGLRRQIRDFERVLNAYYPTVTDLRLTGWRRDLLRFLSAGRYHFRFYAAPYELRAAQRLFHYQRPETTGF